MSDCPRCRPHRLCQSHAEESYSKEMFRRAGERTRLRLERQALPELPVAGPVNAGAFLPGSLGQCAVCGIWTAGGASAEHPHTDSGGYSSLGARGRGGGLVGLGRG